MTKAVTIDVALAPALLSPGTVKTRSVAVIDVLRASTTLITALSNGAECAIPFGEPQAAKDFYKLCAAGSALLCGERGGRRIAGFDLGNSPSEYTKEKVRGKTLLFTSTNGSRALIAAGEAQTVVVAAFLNAAACAKVLAGNKKNILILCSGWEGAVSLEDTVCAGLIIHEIQKTAPPVLLEDAAVMALALYDAYGKDIPGLLSLSSHGRRLAGLGFEPDLALCGRANVSETVPVYRDGKLILDRSTA